MTQVMALDPPDIAHMSEEPSRSPRSTGSTAGQPDRRGSLGVAVLLAAAAVLAALITARATVLGTQATGLWQRSVGEEQKRGALLLEDARFTYGPVADMAFTVAREQLRADELSAAAAEASPEAASRIAHEAQVHELVAEAFRTSSVIGTDAAYVLPSGGYDLQRSLADDRLGHGADLRLDPQATAAAGDRASDHATRLLSTTVVVGFGFLFGSLAQAARTRRRMLLALGWATLLLAALLALGVEAAT